MHAQEGDLIWAPDDRWISEANVTKFQQWLEKEHGLTFTDSEDMWRWSCDELETFWGYVWKYFDIQTSSPYETVLRERKMPGADWFPGARLNYAEHVLRHEHKGGEAMVSLSELREARVHTRAELGADVRVAATRLRELGVGPGDLVAAYLPNIYEAAVAMLATTAVGAIWSSCSPDFGTRNVVDRFAQLKPKVLLCVDGYRYRGKDFDRRAEVDRILAELDSVEQVIFLPYLDGDAAPTEAMQVAGFQRWSEFMDHPPVSAGEFEFEQVPFNHPLWVLFSSGTTGLPKGIVHPHGGILIEQCKLITFHMDMKPRERMFFYTTTGWMMWNFLVSSMLVEAVPVLYDGNPAHPGPDVLWKMTSELDIAFFGTSPTYVLGLEKAGVVPKNDYEFKSLRSIVLAGSPASPANMAWFSECVKPGLWVSTGSGGTDVCAGFVGGLPTIPSYAGEIQGRHLGVDVHALDEDGNPVINEVGEMVIRKPMPSMPVYFWNDPGNERYLDSYFSTYPGMWRQGDFFKVNERGGCFVLGRSDATLNRQGIRIGTAEIYRTVESVPGVLDSIVVNLDLPGGLFFMPLFVKLAEGVELTDELQAEICQRLKTENSPRHVPDRIYVVDKVPTTLTGKKMEVPVRKILMGVPLEKAANVSVMAEPDAIDYFVEFARERRDYPQAEAS